MVAKHWKIVGIDSLKPFFEQLVPFGQITEKQMIELLKRLASKHLTEGELIDCAKRGNVVGHRDLLRVKSDSRPGMVLLYTTLDPHYLATVVDVP